MCVCVHACIMCTVHNNYLKKKIKLKFIPFNNKNNNNNWNNGNCIIILVK